jgi:mono/diheme cytochrome c family protein
LPRSFANPGTTIALDAPPPVDARRGAQLWLEKGCSSCHGPTGTGDSPVARTMTVPPYDLTREPLHRPRPDGDTRRAAALAIATGRTAMPGYAGSIASADIWALADHVVALGGTAKADRSVIDQRVIDPDRTARIAAATWPAAGDDGVVVRGAVPPQGLPPAALAPAQASPARCSALSREAVPRMDGSLYRGAASPGLAAQMWA